MLNSDILTLLTEDDYTFSREINIKDTFLRKYNASGYKSHF